MNKHRRGNPLWGQAKLRYNFVSTPFEHLVAQLKLSPADYPTSAALRLWVERNYKHHYVPEALLKTWGMRLEACDV